MPKKKTNFFTTVVTKKQFWTYTCIVLTKIKYSVICRKWVWNIVSGNAIKCLLGKYLVSTVYWHQYIICLLLATLEELVFVPSDTWRPSSEAQWEIVGSGGSQTGESQANQRLSVPGFCSRIYNAWMNNSKMVPMETLMFYSTAVL